MLHSRNQTWKPTPKRNTLPHVKTLESHNGIPLHKGHTARYGLLGPKEIENTQLYIQLDNQLFQNIPEENFTMRAVGTLEEAVKLGEVGFEPFMVIKNGVQLMRKRK